MEYFNVSKKSVEKTRDILNKIRNKGKELDELSYKNLLVTGFENHLIQLCMSDFDGDYKKYDKFITDKLIEIKKREPIKKKLRLGYIGVPPMTGDLYEYVEGLDSLIIYNEVQREFAFPRNNKAKNIVDQYYDYTYPYDFDFRLKDIQKTNTIKKIRWNYSLYSSILS